MFSGRKVIYTSTKDITRDNIATVMTNAMEIHQCNALACNALYKYYKGDQPIWNKTNDTRQDINNIIVENRANEIVSFKTGYLMGEPIQYVSRNSTKKQVNLVNKLNTYMNYDSKASKDKELAEWFYICGTAYRMILPNDPTSETPFSTYVLNPATTFVVYSNDIKREPVLACVISKTTDIPSVVTYNVYTKDWYYLLDETYEVMEYIPHYMKRIPIIEYPANNARLGSFEIVITILDAINRLQSDRLDAVDMFVQALLVIKNAQLEEGETIESIKKKGGLFLPKDAEISYLTQSLDQHQTQTLADNMYQSVLTICGMPNRNGGSSTSDTGTAVVLRDGWSAAEARAKDQELMFKLSERQLLEIAGDIMSAYNGEKLEVKDIDIRFTRRNYENISEKSTVLTTLLANNKIHPKLAFEHCGMFADSDLAYTISQEYYDKQVANQVADLQDIEKENLHEE